MDNSSYQELAREYGLDDEELFEEFDDEFADQPEHNAGHVSQFDTNTTSMFNEKWFQAAIRGTGW